MGCHSRAQLNAIEREAISESSPQHEAQVIFRLVERGVETLDSARALIAIPPRLQTVLYRYAREYGVAGVSKALRFRANTLREFELLARDAGFLPSTVADQTEPVTPEQWAFLANRVAARPDSQRSAD